MAFFQCLSLGNVGFLSTVSDIIMYKWSIKIVYRIEYRSQTIHLNTTQTWKLLEPNYGDTWWSIGQIEEYKLSPFSASATDPASKQSK